MNNIYRQFRLDTCNKIFSQIEGYLAQTLAFYCALQEISAGYIVAHLHASGVIDDEFIG